MNMSLGVVMIAAMMGANVAQAMFIGFNVTQGSPEDKGAESEAGFTDIGPGMSTVGNIEITVGEKASEPSPGYTGTIAYEGYGASGGGTFITINSATAMSALSINVSRYVNQALYATWITIAGPVFSDPAPSWWSEDGGVTAGFSNGNKTFTASYGAELFVNGGIVINETPGVPEPGTIVLLGSLLGLGTLGGLRKRFFGEKKSVVA